MQKQSINYICTGNTDFSDFIIDNNKMFIGKQIGYRYYTSHHFALMGLDIDEV